MDPNKKILLGIFAVFVIIGTLVYVVYVSTRETRPLVYQKEEAHKALPPEKLVGATQPEVNRSRSTPQSDTAPASGSSFKKLIKKDMTVDEKLAVKEQGMVIDTSKTYSVVLKTTAGDITLDLFANQVPKTVNNFVYLSSLGFYKDTIFHRVIKDFMIQGGDPKGDGTGGPSYRIQDEVFSGDYKRGTIAMARTALPNSAGSQFFIIHKDTPLPKDYVIFGQVTKGVEVVDKIAEAETVLNELEGVNSKPKDPVKILDILVIEK